MKATNILWDVDDEDLPEEIVIPEDLPDDSEAISEYLSGFTGHCHFGFCIEGGYTA
jgi:hypothetical protein